MGAKYSEMCASSCVVFGERILGSVSVSVSGPVSHGILYKVEEKHLLMLVFFDLVVDVFFFFVFGLFFAL